MRKVIRFWKIVIFDLVGISLMVIALLTGWLPGPGGIPLFIIGLSILAIHHDWAQKYIDKIREYVKKIGEQIFTEDKYVQVAYDIICPILIAAAAYMVFNYSAAWQITVIIILIITAVTLFLGNRNRWHRFRKFIESRHKHS